MKKSLMLFTVILIAYTGFAQNSAIGIPPSNTSAMLEVYSKNKGMLIPRIALASNTDAATVPSPAPYLMLYNTNASNANGLSGPGIYVNMGNAVSPLWKMIGSSETGGVGATGNRGSAGPKGDTGVVVTVQGGGIIQFIAGNASSYVFAGNPVVTTTNATQKILVWGEIPVALLQGSAKQNVNIGAGYQPQAGGPIQNMAGIFKSVNVEISSIRYTQAFAGMVQPGAGTWKIGPVVLNTGAAVLIDTDYGNFLAIVVE